jgi:hypothetical protein
MGSPEGELGPEPRAIGKSMLRHCWTSLPQRLRAVCPTRSATLPTSRLHTAQNPVGVHMPKDLIGNAELAPDAYQLLGLCARRA